MPSAIDLGYVQWLRSGEVHELIQQSAFHLAASHRQMKKITSLRSSATLR